MHIVMSKLITKINDTSHKPITKKQQAFFRAIKIIIDDTSKQLNHGVKEVERLIVSF
jgi:hypothetical protein